MENPMIEVRVEKSVIIILIKYQKLFKESFNELYTK